MISALVRRSFVVAASPSIVPRSGPFTRSVGASPVCRGLLAPCRDYVSVQGSEVKVGDIIERDNRLFEVVGAEKARTGGRGAAYNQLVLKDIKTGKRSTERVRAAEDIDSVDIRGTMAKFIGVEIKGQEDEIVPFTPTKEHSKISRKFVFEEANGDLLKVSEDIIPIPQKYYLNYYPSVKLIVLEDTEDVVSLTFASCVSLSIESVKNGVFTLENGRTLKHGTEFLKVGDVVYVNVEEESFNRRL